MPLPAVPSISWLDPATTLIGSLYYSNDADLVFSTPEAGVTRLYQVFRNNTLVYSGAAEPPLTVYQVDGVFVEGTYSVRVTDTNAEGSRNFALNFVLDVTAPVAPVIALATDSGNATDNITNISDLSIITGDGVQFAIEPNGGGELVWLSLADMNAALATRVDGGVVVLARQVDRAGNISPETRLTYYIDRTAPAAPEVIATGNDEELNVTVPFDSTESYRYRVAGTTEWSAPSTTAPTGLPNGTYDIEVTATDVAGNATPTIVTVTVDNPALPTVALTSDTGTSATDFITNTEAITVTPVDGTTAEFSYDNGTTWVTAQRTDLADGDYSVLVRQVDATGDASPVVTVAFTLDTIAAALTPAATMTDTAFLALTTFAGQETGALIEYSTDGGATWSFDRPRTSLDDGDVITLRQTDLAGNVSDTATITIDLPDVVVPPTDDRVSAPIHETNLGGLF